MDKSLTEYMNATPRLISTLYNLELLPEQVEKGSVDYYRMVRLIKDWKAQEISDRTKPRDI